MHRFLSLGLIAVIFVSAVGCAAKAPELRGAYFPIPSYAPAEIVDRDMNAAFVEGDDGRFHILYFELKTPDNVSQIMQFYQKQLPQATRIKTEEGSDYKEQMRWTPPNAEKGEGVTIYAKDGKILIAETVVPKKHGR